MATLPELIDNLVADEWRADNPFSPEVAECHSRLFNATDDGERADLMRRWLEHHQPCLFGQLAAKHGQMEFCFLTDDDFTREDRHVGGVIAESRLNWRRRARRGESHAFVILAVSEAIANAEPNTSLLEVAQRIVELYLCRDVPADRIVHDELFLEAGESRSWKVGVNFFSAQADGRWWKDHRIPGGLAFSMNSIGHMACVRRLLKHMDEEDQSEGLHWALRLAMQLIDRTKPGPSGRNTRLHETALRPEREGVNCPIDLPKTLSGKNRCEYAGQYHTDQTLPSAYFTPAVERPEGPLIEDLDLTYLFHDSPENPEFKSMGAGLPQR